MIAFDLGDDQQVPAGEVYVSVDCAQRVAATRGLETARELALYVVHGALHLCGYDDLEQQDRARMRESKLPGAHSGSRVEKPSEAGVLRVNPLVCLVLIPRHQSLFLE